MLAVAADCDPAWVRLADGVKKGQTPIELALGQSAWEYFETDPEKEHVFSQAMVSSLPLRSVICSAANTHFASAVWQSLPYHQSPALADVSYQATHTAQVLSELFKWIEAQFVAV